ncbi:PMD domain-containing protein, partial [Cephalotus follicularis]
LELSAFLAMWLSRYIFPGNPRNGVSWQVFPLALKLAKGMSFHLAHAFLGTVYELLDLYKEAMEHSKGKYVYLSFIDIAFLQIFMWERFLSLAKPVARADGEEPSFRTLRWCGIKKSRNVKRVLDRESEFCFRPYVVDVGEFKAVINYPENYQVVRMAGDGGYIRDPDKEMSLIFPFGYMLAMVEEATSQSVGNAFTVMVYSLSLVAPQFGFSQGVYLYLPSSRIIDRVGEKFHDITFFNSFLDSLEFAFLERKGVGKDAPSWIVSGLQSS